MDNQERLQTICKTALQSKGLEEHSKRLDDELYEVEAQGEFDYLLELYDNKTKFADNENNLFIAYLLDIVSDWNPNEGFDYVQGEFPDVDIDYLPEVRDYLKNQWAAEKYGQENICSIGTYGTLGIKSAMLDMAKIYGYEKSDIQAITVKMEDKDDDGNLLEWDKALELYPDFKKYCDEHQEVAESAKMLLDRNRSGGVHAGGLIVANCPISDFVPLEVRSVKKDNPKGHIVSAWSEGQSTQDLQPVGLIKFDLLVVNGLKQYGMGAKLVKERYGLSGICCHEESMDWSDTSYLNDPKAIAMANDADLKGIFQFDSDVLRKMVKAGGVTSFDDLPAYSSLNRPGPLNMKMDQTFCERKQGTAYKIHPLMKPILGGSYGVMIYQEQVMKMLNVVGGIPLIHCEKIRKAISKKKEKEFIKYKEQFISNGQQKMNVSEEFMNDLWDQIEAFAAYGFNKSVDTCTLIPSPSGEKEIKDFQPGDKVYCVNEDGETVETDVVQVHDHGVLDAFEVEFDDGYTVVCSADHKFLTKKGQMPLREICRTNSYILLDQYIGESYGKRKEGRVEDSLWKDGQNQEIDVPTSQGMSQMFTNRMGQESVTQISLWDGISNLERSRRSSTKLQKLRSDQREEYPRANETIKQGQRTSRSQKDIFRNSEENFCQTRDTISTCCSTQEMERRESRKVCEMYRSGLEKSKTISDGSLASRSLVGLGDEADSLRRKEKTGRFCERQNLDRSRWILSFLRANFCKGVWQSKSRSTTRRDVEGGVSQKGRCDVDSLRHDVFQEQFGSDAGGMVRVVAGHAPIANTGCLASRRVVGVRYVGKRQMCDLEVANPTHNFLLPNGIVTSNSHAYAYAYISARQLWLKAHYPLEFFCAVLDCEKKQEKIKTYKIDAKKHNVEVCGVHINKSKESFVIGDDNKIYFGFGKIKGVGKEVAARIVEGQPYSSFSDFLNRWGTESKVIKPLIALGAFEEDYDNVTLYKFYEFFKDHQQKRRSRQKRNVTAMEKYQNDLEDVLAKYLPNPDLFGELNQFDDEEIESRWKQIFGDMIVEEEYKYKGEMRTRNVSIYKKILNIATKRSTSIRTFEERERDDDERPPHLGQFNSSKCIIDKATEKLVTNSKEAEGEFYGFTWVHELEESPNYTGLTFEEFEARQVPKGPVEVKILKPPKMKTSRKGNMYWSMQVEDATNKEAWITIWEDDYERFADDFIKDSLVRIWVQPPFGGFNSYNLDSPKKHERARVLPQNKADDHRVFIMEKKEGKKTPIKDENQPEFEII